MKYTKAQTAQISRQATYDYFIEGKEDGLLKLIEIIQSMFIKRISTMNIPQEEVDEALQDLTLQILKTLPSYKFEKTTNTTSFVTYFHMQIIGQVQTLVYKQNYPHLNSSSRNDIMNSKIINCHTEDEIEEIFY